LIKRLLSVWPARHPQGDPATVQGRLTTHRAELIRYPRSHHGYARPLLPPITDPAPLDIDVNPDGITHGKLNSADVIDWDSPVRFARLCARYGRWGLALLESIVRLADIWCSARSEEPS
jgi:CRISPR-associated endonuclease/helicase Cas3